MMRDFTSLKPHQVVQLAIAVEKANAKRLETFADMFESYDPSVGRIFRQLVQEEHQHRQLLERQYEQKFGPLPSELEVAEGDVRQVVEAVDVTDGEHFVFDDMTPLDALQAALKAEKRARLLLHTGDRSHGSGLEADI